VLRAPDGRDQKMLGPAEIARRLTLVMAAEGAASGADRARVVIVRKGKVAAIERFRQGQHYWVMPGGGVEKGETVAQAALREAVEELGVAVRLGSLRAVIYDRLEDASVQRHWCFDASTDTDDIAIGGGPEASPAPGDGSYSAVWLELGVLGTRRIWPPALVALIAVYQGNWPDEVLEVSGGITVADLLV
jgi:8-oxo-dGTP diphosphatase